MMVPYCPRVGRRYPALIFLQLSICFSLACIVQSSGSDRPGSSESKWTYEPQPAYLLTGTNGVVASDEIRCSTIGINVLKDNGTATDAAIATALCLGTVNSFSSGIGGGGFMIIKPPAGCKQTSTKPCSAQTPIAINFRETMPDGNFFAASTLKNSSVSEVGGPSISIPGELAGFDAAYRRFGGGVSWKRIFQPSIDLAKNFTVGFALASKISIPDIESWMESKPEWQTVFQPNHQPAQSGDWIQRPHYARTLEIIAEQGIHPFYHGEIAEQLVETINREGGRVDLKDFQSYQPVIEQAINTTYHGYNVWTTGAPSSGGILLHILNILERYSLHHHPRDALSEHRFAESLKFAAAARTELGDPKFLNSTHLARLEQIRSKAYGLETSLKIDDNRTYDYSHYNPKYDNVEDHGTTHLSVIDRFGSVVSLTSTINLYFGSNVMDPVNGIILNDQNDDFGVQGRSNAFNLLSSPFNHPVTGKRPLSSAAPTIVDYLHPQPNKKDDEPQLENQPPEFFCALGASGGSRIYGAVAGTFLKLLWGYDISHAIEDPRLHHQLLPNEASIEKTYRADFLDGLKSRGHKIAMIEFSKMASIVNGIHKRISDNVLFGSSDSRKGGVPAAY
ncbi:gamma-glutamyltransferase [Puccinia triticina 1-1 BBBD Race 1]|uniref:Glutathione hydrolase n=1 Tax=Puccinia triticina (isolate 1-1 / race 1 (BBBD)) TaxID=630390 RepID=A0A180GNX8_PUCT1|nr:gamma-glutamyltransferase [Puccinia triticina 1-1 BBBD Race 1]